MKSSAPDLALSVRPAQDSDRSAWNAFVLAQPEGTFFHLAEWQDVLRKAFGHRTQLCVLHDIPSDPDNH